MQLYYGKEGFVMHAWQKGVAFVIHDWQRRDCHACMANVSCMHGKRGFVMHAWQRRVCHTGLAKEGLSVMAKKGLSVMAKDSLSYMHVYGITHSGLSYNHGRRCGLCYVRNIA